MSASSASAVSVSGVSKQETASLDCQVDSDPETDVHFWWTFLGTPITKQQQHHQFGRPLIFFLTSVSYIIMSPYGRYGPMEFSFLLFFFCDILKQHKKKENLNIVAVMAVHRKLKLDPAGSPQFRQWE